MTPDPFDDLRTELVRAAAGRSAPRAWRRRRHAATLGLAVLAVGGTATAAVVSQTAEPSAPLAARLQAGASARSYAISIAPDLRAGAVGWCTTVRFTSDGRPTGFAADCGGAAAGGVPSVAGAFGVAGRGLLRQEIVTRRVAVVVFPGNRRVVPRAEPRLPFGWRAAILYEPSARYDPRRPDFASFEDARGRPIANPFSQSRFARGARSRKVTGAQPATRCVIGAAAGFRVVHARVAVGKPRVPRLEDPAFGSCARTVFRRRGGRRTSLNAAILRDAERPAARAATLPPTPGLLGRRLGPAWLVVSGGTTADRRELLAALDARL